MAVLNGVNALMITAVSVIEILNVQSIFFSAMQDVDVEQIVIVGRVPLDASVLRIVHVTRLKTVHFLQVNVQHFAHAIINVCAMEICADVILR